MLKVKNSSKKNKIQNQSFERKFLLSKENWTMDKWWEYFYSRDKCILATSTENMNKEPIVSKFRVPKGLFRSSGFSFKVRDEETKFLKEFAEWQFLPSHDLERKVIEIFEDSKFAKRKCSKVQSNH